MASTATVIRELTIQARTEGVEQATAKLRDLGSAHTTVQDAVSRANARLPELSRAHQDLAQAADRASTTVDTSARRMLSAGPAYDRLKASIDSTYRSQRELERNTAVLDRALNQGRITVAEHERTMAQLQARYDSTAAAAQRSARAQASAWKDLGDAGRRQLENVEASRKLGSLGRPGASGSPTAANENGRLRADQVQNLAFQASDVVSSLGSGSSLGTVALQQGPQVAQVFAGTGASVRAAFAQAGEAAAGLAARVGLVGGAIGAAATATVAAVVAQQSYAASQRALERSLTGVGRASGVTAGQLSDLAAASASAGGISNRTARDLAGGFASTGRIGSEMIGGLLRTVKDFAATTGQEMPDAAAALAEAFADPEKGADRLNERLGFLNDTTRESIARLQAQGDRLGAQRTLFEAYSGSLVKASETMSGWGRITEAVGTTIGNLWDKVGQKLDRVITGGSLEQQLEAARRTLENAQVAAEGGFGLFSSRDVERAQAALDKLEARAAAIRQQSERAQAGQNSLAIGSLIRSTQPDLAELKKLQDGAEQLRKALGEPSKFNLDMVGLYNANNAFGNLSRAVQALTEDIDRFGSRAVAAMNRAADLANRTVSFSPTARSAAEIRDRYEQLERTADSRELAGLRQAMNRELDTLRQQTMRTAAQGGGSFSTSIAQVPERFRSTVYDRAIQYGQDPDLIASILKRESQFNPNAVSKAGAQGIAQFMPDTARGMGLSNPFDPVASIDAMVRHVRDLNVKYNGNIPDILSGYNRGEPNTDKWIRAGRDPSTMPDETRKYIAAITTKGPGTDDLVKAEQERTAELQRQNQAVKDNAALYGKDALTLEARTSAEERLQRDQLRGVEITDSYRAAVMKSAQASAEAARALASTRLGGDLQFEREQLGRTSAEQTAFSRARSAFGDTDNPAARAAISTSLLNDNLRQTKDLAKDAFGGFASDLMRGTTALDALRNALSRVADRLLNLATDKIFSNLFGSLTGSGTPGAGGGDFLGSIGKALGSAFGFSGGGYTGAGGVLQPAGVVHRGEVVWSQRDVARAGGVGAVEAMRLGMRGYAVGGPVGDGYSRQPAPNQGEGGGGGGSQPVQVVINNVPSDHTANATVSQSPQGPKVEVQLEKMLGSMVADGRLDRVLRQRYGMRATGG